MPGTLKGNRLVVGLADPAAADVVQHGLDAAYGLVEPAMSLEEVQAIRTPGVVDQIGQEVIARSGLANGLGALLW